MNTNLNKQAILECIEADAPCSFAHILHDAKTQGYAGRFPANLHELIREGVITMDSEQVIELV